MSADRQPLTARERRAMQEFLRRLGAGQRMGTRKIVSMQGLERAGLVRRVTRRGLIVDWTPTELGRTWTP